MFERALTHLALCSQRTSCRPEGSLVSMTGSALRAALISSATDYIPEIQTLARTASKAFTQTVKLSLITMMYERLIED
jgi:hypothetical protein